MLSHIFSFAWTLLLVRPMIALVLVSLVKSRRYARPCVASLVKPGCYSPQRGLNKRKYLHNNQSLLVWIQRLHLHVARSLFFYRGLMTMIDWMWRILCYVHMIKAGRSRFHQFTSAPFYTFKTGKFIQIDRQRAPQWTYFCAAGRLSKIWRVYRKLH